MKQYRRTMTITFESDEWMDSPVLMEKFSSYLHDDGVSLVSAYHYGDVDDKDYGLREVKRVKSSYDILLNDKLAFTASYQFRARELCNELIENGWDAEYFERTEESTKTEWAEAPGSYAFVDSDEFDGTMTTETVYPSLLYKLDGVQLCTKILRNNDGSFSLVFQITKDIHSIADRKSIENSIVTVPAADMRAIKRIVVSVLERISDDVITHSVDCTTEILSSANYVCSKETIDLVMGEEE